MKCRYGMEDLFRYQEQEMTDKERGKLEDHLKECATCRELLKAAAGMEQLGEMELEPRSGFTRSVMLKLDPGRYKEKSLIRKAEAMFYRRHKELKVVIVAACCVLILSGLWLLKASGMLDFHRQGEVMGPATSEGSLDQGEGKTGTGAGNTEGDIRKVEIGWRFETYMKMQDPDTGERYTDVSLAVQGQDNTRLRLGSYAGDAADITGSKPAEIPPDSAAACRITAYDGQENYLYVSIKEEKILSIMLVKKDRNGVLASPVEIDKMEFPNRIQVSAIGPEVTDRDEESKVHVQDEDWFFATPQLYYVKAGDILSNEHENIYQYRRLIRNDKNVPLEEGAGAYVEEKYLAADGKFNTRYAVYAGDRHLGLFEGKLRYDEFYSQFYIGLEGLNQSIRDYIALSRDYNAIPRKVDRAVAVTPDEVELAREYLSHSGISADVFLVVGSAAADLDGDGVQEKLVSFSNVWNGKEYDAHFNDSGMYSFTVLFSGRDGKMQVLAENLITRDEAQKLRDGEGGDKYFNEVYDIPYILDLNEDGNMEVVLRKVLCNTDAGYSLVFFQFREGKLVRP